MKTQLSVAAAVMFAASSIFAEDSKATPTLPAHPTKENLSYALGMNLALQLKNSGVAADPEVIGQAIKDVLAGMPTEIQEGDIRGILQKAEKAAQVKQSSKYIAEGEAFLVKNSHQQGIVALPDGLQYRVIRTGTGEYPNLTQILTLNIRGTWPDGREFVRHEKFEIPFFGCTKGLAEALKMMKVGSKWQVFVPYELAYGHVGEQATRFGSVLIYDLELVNAESETAHPNQHHSMAGRLGHSLDEDVVPQKMHLTENNTR